MTQPDIRYVLTDIEGTTTPITFVHDVLFPYSFERLPAYVREHMDHPEVRASLEETKKTAAAEDSVQIDDEGAIAVLKRWITEDRKHPALKRLQGLLWRDGYESGAYVASVYADVPTALTTWKARGLDLGVYSSGSVAAQKLLFKYSDRGDLTPLFRDYFDTAVGGKKETASYQTILKRLGRPGSEVLFLSDIPEELHAARRAGMHAIQLVRPGTQKAPDLTHAADFEDVERWLTGAH